MSSSGKTAIDFSPTDQGLVRRPPNIETISVVREGDWVWLAMRRNDHELRFPLSPGAARHLADRITEASRRT